MCLRGSVGRRRQSLETGLGTPEKCIRNDVFVQTHHEEMSQIMIGSTFMIFICYQSILCIETYSVSAKDAISTSKETSSLSPQLGEVEASVEEQVFP